MSAHPEEKLLNLPRKKQDTFTLNYFYYFVLKLKTIVCSEAIFWNK